MADEPNAEEPQGSWIPFIVLVTLLAIYTARKIAYGEGRTSMRIRRFYNVQVCFWIGMLVALKRRPLLFAAWTIVLVGFVTFFMFLEAWLGLQRLHVYEKGVAIWLPFGYSVITDHFELTINIVSCIWLLIQRVRWRKKLGLRDESIYKNFSAGDGANQRFKRQG